MASQFPAFPRAVRPAPDPLAHYIYIGKNDHRTALDMTAAGDFACFGGVFDPVYLKRHKELLDQLHRRKLDAILDPRTQPSATPGGYNHSLGELPWGLGRPHTPSDFSGTSGRRLIAAIGDFALEQGFTQILAPTHLLRSVNDEWLDIDIRGAVLLRDYLDRRGGGQVSIIYSLAPPYALLRNSEHRRHLVDALQGIPCNALWLKVDGFGSTSTPTAVLSYIEGARDFSELAIPIVADHAGGIAGLSLLAFGSAGGIAHGVTQGERFSSSSWRRHRTSRGFSAHPRVYFPDIDMLLKLAEARSLLEASPRLKAQSSCRDTKCCPRGITDMLQNPGRHFLYQRMQEIGELSQIPEQMRAQRFIDRRLRSTTDRVLAVANINWRDEAIAKKMREQRKRLDALRIALGEYANKRHNVDRVVLPQTRVAREARA